MEAASQVVKMEDTPCSVELGKLHLDSMHTCFNMGFDVSRQKEGRKGSDFHTICPVQYIHEVFRLVGDEMTYGELGEQIRNYAQLWMTFVLKKCDKGKGQRPK